MAYSKQDLELYFAEKKAIYSQPENLSGLEHDVNLLLEMTTFDLKHKLAACWMFEMLLYIIDLPEGNRMYIKLLNHMSGSCPDITQKYWKIYDNQEDIIDKYYIPALEMPNFKRLLDKLNEEE